ncbi:hypothetical protein, partial [uncultured Gimesia sp.]
MEGFHLQTSTLIHLLKVDGEEGISVCAGPNTDESRWVNSLLSSKAGTLILPIGEKPSDKVVSRFIGKVGLEVLAHRALDDPEILDEIVNKTELDQLRDYVRMVTVSRNTRSVNGHREMLF